MEFDTEVSEVVEVKRQHLEKRKADRDSENTSILEHFGGIQDDDVVSRLSDSVVTIEDKPSPCPECRGMGYVKSLFAKWECASCFGTTYDLSDPVAVIKWQQLCLDWAKNDVMKSRQALLNATTTAEERMSKAVEGFYADAARKD